MPVAYFLSNNITLKIKVEKCQDLPKTSLWSQAKLVNGIVIPHSGFSFKFEHPKNDELDKFLSVDKLLLQDSGDYYESDDIYPTWITSKDDQNKILICYDKFGNLCDTPNPKFVY